MATNKMMTAPKTMPHHNEVTEANLVYERSGIDPDCRERSLTKRFVNARALSFLGSKKLRSQQFQSRDT